MAFEIERVREIVERVAASNGLEVVEVELRGGGKARMLRIVIDRASAGDFGKLSARTSRCDGGVGRSGGRRVNRRQAAVGSRPVRLDARTGAQGLPADVHCRPRHAARDF